MDDPQLHEITLHCRKCKGQRSTYWTEPGDQYTPVCPDCTEGVTDRVPTRRKD